jgi:hypothetical protein
VLNHSPHSSYLSGFVFSFFPILWYSKTGNHQQEDLAKFGYKPDSESGKIYESLSYLAMCWNLL